MAVYIKPEPPPRNKLPMKKKQLDLPIHMYHRIYRLAHRDVPPDRIALTLDLPLKTVQRILEKFAQPQGNISESLHAGEDGRKAAETFLDIYIIPKVRYIVADFSGWVTTDHAGKLKSELEGLAASQWKVIALLMRDVLGADATGMEAIISFHESTAARGRYCAILDPSAAIESIISENRLEERIPIFGTEKTFEDAAFSSGRDARLTHKPAHEKIHPRV